jgi:hypothetical protein
MIAQPGRVELKYAVPEDVAARVLRVGRAFLEPDADAVGPRQRITSLYLDTPDRTFLRWHRERAADRFKLRLRRYGEGMDGPVFAEVKRKTWSVVRKRRARLPSCAVADLLCCARLPRVQLSAPELDHLSEFLSRRVRFGARPEVLITYVRESLRGVGVDKDTAITVDREMCFQRMTHATVVGVAAGWTPIPPPRVSRSGMVILELKYSSQAPAWMQPLIVRLAAARISFSKYVAAATRLSGES